MEPPRTIEELSRLSDDQIDVGRGAALLARDVYPSLDVDKLVHDLDALAAPLEAADLARLDLEDQARAISTHMYVALGFRGNEDDYYDLRNSLLPDVLERRLGIPITLSLVYCELARRAGVRARGVSFPGHFIVRLEREGDPDEHLLVDPFYGGRALDGRATLQLLRRALGPDAELKPEHTAAAGPRAVLVRMLANLKSIYLSRGELPRAHLVLDRIVTLLPEHRDALKQHAALAVRLGSHETARADLNKLLALDPPSAEVATIKRQIEALDRAKRRLN